MKNYSSKFETIPAKVREQVTGYKYENKLKNPLQIEISCVKIRATCKACDNASGRMMLKVMDWIRKITDIIMPLEPIAEEEEEEAKKVEEKASAQPAATVAPKKVATGGGTSYTSETVVNTSDSGSMSMDGMRYMAYSDVSSTATARPSLTVVKPHELTVKIYSPENFDQVVGIADDILGKRAAVVNYERVAESDQRKICDFVNGVCYATDGSVNMISDRIFLYMPPGIESGEIARIATSVRIR